jgi:hypothetical protein
MVRVPPPCTGRLALDLAGVLSEVYKVSLRIGAALQVRRARGYDTIGG